MRTQTQSVGLVQHHRPRGTLARVLLALGGGSVIALAFAVAVVLLLTGGHAQ